ncbi:MAG: tetratricopeptide repeat protein [Dysgonamonadaceae bacterium]|jgi:tetratricopeptide (TPR) repeat protein|nr:tetratricopeptide repeat protein [Dysgonamonadaceae bacterium]
MKKLLFTGFLCFAVTISFAQKKAVNSAKNEIKGSTPNIAEARNAIKEALTNPETANEAETWFVAGQVEDKQFDMERTKEVLGQKPNEDVMYGALEGTLPYFIKASELDQLPDAKGKVKPKYLKDVRARIRANRQFYVNAGIYYYEKENYQKAYENFKLFGDIPKMEIFNDDKWTIVSTDTAEIQIRYYAGLAAALIPDNKGAIGIFSEIKDSGFNENDVYQRLCYLYNQAEDSVLFEKTVKEGFTKFPTEPYYVLNLINLSIAGGKEGEAIAYLESAIAQSPNNSQLYDVMGQVYESKKDYENAIVNLQKALELEPDNKEALSHIGRVYFNMGVDTRSKADSNSDAAKSKADSQKSLDYFKQAMPFFEKAYSLSPDSKDAIYALRSIYYNLGMGDQYEKMDALYNAGNQ